jgi:hypothetical protein
METVIGFIVGYLVGTSQGRDGMASVRKSLEAIRKSPESRRLAAQATGIAGIVLKHATRPGLAGAIGEVTGGLTGQAPSQRPGPA